MYIQPDIVSDSGNLKPRTPITYNSPHLGEDIFGRLTRVVQFDGAIVYQVSNGHNTILAVLLPDQKDAVYVTCS